MVAVDDVQWLDPPSAKVLSFAWRRLREEPVGLLLAHRLGTDAPAGLAEDDRLSSLAVGPLALGAVHRLLHERLGSRPAAARAAPRPRGQRRQPVSPSNSAARSRPTRPCSRPANRCRYRIAFRSSFVRGSRRCRRRAAVLAAAAALSQPTLELLAAVVSDGADALRPALESQVVELDGERVRFTHPLLASAAYQGHDAIGRRNLHRRLAEVVPDVDERVRHLALSTDAPDSDVARPLEEAAEHARARGASAKAAELCEQACRLTPLDEPDAAHRRTVAAARYRFVAGDTARARGLLEEVLPSTRGGDGLAEALVLLGRLHRYEGDQPQAAELLRRALAETSASDRVRAEAAQGLAATLFFMREDLEVAQGHAALAAELAARAGAFTVQAESLDQPHRSPARAFGGSRHLPGRPRTGRCSRRSVSQRFAELCLGGLPVLDG